MTDGPISVLDALDAQARQVKRYGFHRSLGRPDEAVANVALLKVLSEVDPRSALAAWILNQLALGSCTANATSNVFRYDRALDGHDPGPLSRLWIYRGERILEGTLAQGDVGAEGHDAYTVAKHGIPPETSWPYDTATFNDTPPAEATKDDRYYVLRKTVAAVPQSLQAIKAVLSNKQLISLGFTVYESFESGDVTKSGIVPMPEQGEQILGGHEVVLVGYLKSEPHYGLCMNSWGSRQTDGSEWGLDGSGFFLMPWAYLLDRSLTSDLRTITRPVAS